VGESCFWYRPTRVVPDQRPLNGRVIVKVPLCADTTTNVAVIEFDDFVHIEFS